MKMPAIRDLLPDLRLWSNCVLDHNITALEYPVPEHPNNLAWSLGGVTAAAFVLLIVTGVLLVQFYNPLPEAANQSVRLRPVLQRTFT